MDNTMIQYLVAAFTFVALTILFKEYLFGENDDNNHT